MLLYLRLVRGPGCLKQLIIVAALSLALKLVLTGAFIAIVKGLL
jgi:hypothetical protein